MDARTAFKASFRAARLNRKHRILGEQAYKPLMTTLEPRVLIAGIYALRDGPRAFGIESARKVMRLGLSGRKCIALNLHAVRARRQTGWVKRNAPRLP